MPSKLEALKEEHGGFTQEFQDKKFKIGMKHMIQHRIKIHELSKEALKKRKEGMINYRRWFRDEMLKISIKGREPFHE